MTLQDAFALFRRFGVDPELLSQKEFSAAYYRLAWRYHPDVNPAAHALMANINAARTTILNSYCLSQSQTDLKVQYSPNFADLIRRRGPHERDQHSAKG